MSINDRIFGLDFLRAAAIIMILLANCIYIFPVINPTIAQLANLAGFFGLEIFLVLSGFLLSKTFYPIYINKDFGLNDVLTYIKVRLIRIWPLYVFVLLVNIGIASYMDYPVVGSWKYFFFIQNITQPIPAFFPESWGLPVIVFGILLLPALLLILTKIFKSLNKSDLFCTTTLVLIMIFLFTKWTYNDINTITDMSHWNVSLKSVLIYRLDSFFIGALFGWWSINRNVVWQRGKFLLALIGFFGVAFIFLGVGFCQLVIETHPAFWNIIYLPLTSLAISFILPLLSQWKNSLFDKPVKFISLISYALYLVHFSIVLQLMEQFIFPESESNAHIYLYAVLYVAVTLTIGSILFYIDRSARKKLISS